MKQLFRTIVIIALVFISTQSIAQKPSTPVAVDRYFTSIYDSIHTLVTDWAYELSDARDTKKFAQLAGSRKIMEGYVKTTKTQLSSMKDIGGSEKLRAVMIEFLVFEEKMISQACVPFEKLKSSATDEDVENLLDRLDDLSDGESDILTRMEVEQKKFAARNGFTLPEKNSK